ncbi:hypothetical protein [Sphingosinicella humi]|nr:hypothetical protein [Sphingosinicella humi]
MDSKEVEAFKAAREAAERASVVSRVALIIACMSIALAILGLFLPI